jgi:ribosomal protein L6P/L9E
MQIKILSNFIEKFVLFTLIKDLWVLCSFGVFSNHKFGFVLQASFWKISYQINSWIDLFFFGVMKNYKHYLELKGTGYKFRLIDQLYFFGLTLRLGHSHLIYMPISKKFRIFFFNKHTLCFYNNNLWTLNNQVNLIAIQNKPNSYKEKGFFWKHSILKLKKSTKLKF